jgi:hypothetical protein
MEAAILHVVDDSVDGSWLIFADGTAVHDALAGSPSGQKEFHHSVERSDGRATKTLWNCC